MKHLLSFAMLLAASASADTCPPEAVAGPDQGASGTLPIRFNRAHGTASAYVYGNKPGSRQRKRRKQQRQRGGR